MFVNDIFKKKQITETVLNPRDPQGDYDAKRKVLHDLSLDPQVDQQAVQQRRLDLDREARAKGLKEQDIDEAGPFSYGARKPKKGSVADLAAQKRKEQEKGKQPAEPRDQRVGVARVTKDVAEGFDDLDRFMKDKYGPQPRGGSGIKTGTYGKPGRRRGRPTGPSGGEGSGIPQAVDFDRPHSERSAGRKLPRYSDDYDALKRSEIDEDWKKVNRQDRTPGMSRKAVKAYRRENPGSKLQTAVTTKPSKLKKGSKSAKRRKSFCARMKGMKRAHAGAKTKRNPDSPINKALRRWNCESIEEMRNLVMIAEQKIKAMRLNEGAEKLLGKMIPGGASVFNAADAVRRFRSGDTVGAGIAAAGTIPITSIPAAAADMARDKYYTGSFLPSDEQRDLANLNRQVADMEKKNWTKLPDGSERSPDGHTIRGTITKLSAEPQSKPVPGSMKPDSSELPSKSYPDDAQKVKEQQATDPVSRFDQTMRQPSISDKPGTKYYVGGTEVTGQEFDTVKQQHMASRSQTELDLDDFAQQARQKFKPKVRENSSREKLYQRHQELRKKSGLPDPDYYKELKASYDLPDEERYAKQKEIKQKYKVTNEDRERYIEELGRAGYEIVNERRMTCPECGGVAYEDRMLAEKQDACYHKVKSRYKVWPSAYASGALVRCRKKGAKNWGNKSK